MRTFVPYAQFFSRPVTYSRNRSVFLKQLVSAILPVVFLILMITHTTVYGQQNHAHGHSVDSTVMENIVVTADRIDEYIENYPNQVVMLSKENIARRNMFSVEEAMRSMPGVDVKRSSGIGSRISIRGSGKSGGVLVLLNGRPLNSSQYGGADLSTIPIDIVQSIIVFKPPVPVWLGPGGSDGAINIVTCDPIGKKEKKRHSTQIRGAAGSYGLIEGSLTHRNSLDLGTIMATAAGTHQDGKRTNGGRYSGTVCLHWDRKSAGEQQMEIDGRYYESEYGSTGPMDNPTPDARQEYKKFSVDGRIGGIVDNAWDYAINLYGDTVDLKDESQFGPTSTLDSVKWGLKGESNWCDEDNTWELHLNGIVERDDVNHTLSGQHHRVTAGLGAQVDRHWESLTGTVGLRGDHTNNFDFIPGFSSGLSFSPTKHWTAKVNAGYTMNIPTFGQLYQPSHGSIDQVRGNPDLDKEKIWSYDAGIEYRRNKTHLFQVSLFRSDTQNPIVYQRGIDLIYRPVNTDRSWRHGLELTFKHRFDFGLTGDINAIVQDSKICDTEKELPYTPQVKLKGSLQYTLPEPGTRLETTISYCSKQYSEVKNRKSERIDDYITMDLKAVQPFKFKTMAAEWFVTVENLFDADYQIHYGYPDDGIRFVSGLNLKF